MRMLGRKLSFWIAVAGVSVMANFGLEYITSQSDSLGLARFTGFAHRGNG
jgi:hypothetical protein